MNDEVLTFDRLSREREFHDRLAAQFDPAEMPPRPLGSLERAMLAAAGDLRGKRVLDLGCGSGDLTLALARAGARMTAVDLSPGMVELARRRLDLFAPGTEAEFVVAPAESLPLPDATVDLIVGRFILHHLDLTEAAGELSRVLAPGGVALFVENSGRNPLLMLAREHLAGRFGIPRYGTLDERPLSAGDLELIRDQFSALRLEYPVFEFLTLLDRQILHYRRRSISRLLRALDRWVWRVAPWARKWSFRVVVIARA
jgi:ubiquinone/menaquinone biosynthesis C-methylase UbiE